MIFTKDFKIYYLKYVFLLLFYYNKIKKNILKNKKDYGLCN